MKKFFIFLCFLIHGSLSLAMGNKAADYKELRDSFLCKYHRVPKEGMDFIALTRVESPFSHEKRDKLYESKRDDLLCSYKCLYPDELEARYSVKERNEMIMSIQHDLEKRVTHLKNELIQELWQLTGGVISTAAGGGSYYYSDNSMHLVGFLGFLLWSAIYFESTIWETKTSLRFNRRYLKKFKTVEMLKNLQIIISDNYEEK